MYKYLLFGGKKWTQLIHNGVLLAPPYQVHQQPVIINNQEIKLTPLEEEFLTYYAKYLDTIYVENPKFNKNFYNDFLKLSSNPIFKSTKLENIDFTPIINHINKQKEIKNNLSPEQKEKIKNIKLLEEEKYQYALLDGEKVKVGNYRIEPPGIFLGRGKHPLIGKIKKRINHNDITLNLSKDAPVPSGDWKEIIHDNNAEWLAKWKDPITNKTKYMFLSMESPLKASSDEAKFNLARKLINKIKSIREKYLLDIQNNNLVYQQLGVALYLIDELALRVGSKKKETEADTVGVTSLRVEHIIILNDKEIKLDFLGKDSIRFCKVISLPELIHQRIKQFMDKKDKSDQLFDLIDNKMLNNYLEQFMKGLTAKVFRTFKASFTFQKEINKINLSKLDNLSPNDKINFLMSMVNQANASVATLCNHQKVMNQRFNEQVEKLEEKIKNYKQKIKKLKEKKNNKDKIDNYQNKIILIKEKIQEKKSLKNISLGTSKTNYIDPRILISFAKRNNIPLEKLFTPSLLNRFKWAIDINPEFQF